MRVAVVYHFFPHYRAAVLRELLRSPEHEYVLVGDEKPTDPSIEAWKVSDRGRFILAPCRWLRAPFLFQTGLLELACDNRFDAIIYLGNPHFISTWMSAALARLNGRMVFFWTHGWTRNEYGLKGWLRRLFYKLPHALMLYGHTAKMAGIEHGFPTENLHVIYNSLDYEAQKKIRGKVTTEELRSLKRRLFDQPSDP